MTQYTILIVDDEQEIGELLEVYLVNEGYRVIKTYTGIEGLQVLEKEPVHLVILDIMLPEIDGLEVCRRIRKKWNVPILMLSAKSHDMDKILGLSTGADDYLTKPFNPMELIARVKSQIRRYLYLNNVPIEAISRNRLQIKDLEINKDNHQVSYLGKHIGLTPTEYQILVLLAQNPGKIFSSEDIFEKVWKEKYFESNNTVMVHMWRLREKLEINPKEPKVIQTVWGVGYKIEA